MNASSVKPGVLCVGSFAPPLHGVSASLGRIADDLQRHAEVKRFTISPGTTPSPAYHLVRSVRVCVAILGMAVCRLRGFERLYTAADADWGTLYTCTIVAMARLCGYRVFVHHHSFAYLIRRSYAMSLLVWLGGRSTTHVLLCECMRDQFCALYSAGDGQLVVSNAAHVKSSPKRGPRSPVKARPCRIGHLSNLCYEKGFAEVVDVFETLVAEGLNVELVLAGPTADTSIQQRIDQLKLRHDGRFVYLGMVTGEDKQRFFETIDVFLFPTRYTHEAQPYVLIEGISAGVPCIALRRGCIAETLRSNGNCVIEDPRQFTSVACRTIKSWIDDPAAWQQASDAVLLSSARQFAEAQTGYSQLLRAVAGLNGVENLNLVTPHAHEQFHANP